ncbi:hypothetical protein M3I54_01135 [Paraburkholderia sp. CNPSo 3274]|uniref:hypothetical protein n=1 Tax=Paraburkholderia sp. CNPSo 3274 TaxID=2940932 RepID=UPI0020B86C49|nr:hypothetical protein [Paraburkholderia sp. CNPSo 3274]MCP3705608.1 hypothetical protein [Paraburkholderia sp. CNPSo 3274]
MQKEIRQHHEARRELKPAQKELNVVSRFAGAATGYADDVHFLFPPFRVPRLQYREPTPVIPAPGYREKIGNKTAALAVLHLKPALEALHIAPAVDFLNPVERTSCRQIFLPNRHAAAP